MQTDRSSRRTRGSLPESHRRSDASPPGPAVASDHSPAAEDDRVAFGRFQTPSASILVVEHEKELLLNSLTAQHEHVVAILDGLSRAMTVAPDSGSLNVTIGPLGPDGIPLSELVRQVQQFGETSPTHE